MAFVYLLCDSGQDNMFKIGITKKAIEKRIKELQTGNGSEIFLADYHETEYPYYIEKMLHQKFRNNRTNGEWFELDCNNIKTFKEECNRLEELIDQMKNNIFFMKNLK